MLVAHPVQALSGAALNNYERLRLQVVMPTNGYVSAYVGNESGVDVYFDDVVVEHRQGLQVQETHYDPTGLELAGLGGTSPGLKSLSQYRWNGKEFQPDLGLNWTILDWRMVDPQIGGGFHVVDPDVENGQESMSPYVFGFDNAVRFNDPDGRNPGDGGVWGFVTAAVDFTNGFANGMVSNSTTLPNGVSLVGRVSPSNGFEAAGQTGADLVSMVQGAAEFLGGGTAALGGGAVSLSGVGAVVGVPAMAGGVAVAGHGLNTANNAMKNLLNDENGRVYADPGSRKGKSFTPGESKKVVDANSQKNGGKIICEGCRAETTKPQKSQRGVTPPKTDRQIDHKTPKSKGGSGTAENGQVLCRTCNRAKSDK